MYSVHQHWDPLKVCAVGKSYAPKFYDYIKNPNIRNVFYQIAEETEEDYQKLIKLLKSFNVDIIRPEISDNPDDYLIDDTIVRPPVTPRDYTAMIGSTFYMPTNQSEILWKQLAGSNWPPCPQTEEEFNSLPTTIRSELKKFGKDSFFCLFDPDPWNNLDSWKNLIADVKKQGNQIVHNIDHNINSAMITRAGKDLYFGTESYTDDLVSLKEKYSNMFPEYRCHMINTGGHADGTFCAVKPGLIISSIDVPTYKDTFPDWEVIHLSNVSNDTGDLPSFLKLKEKNHGKWWVPGQELNDDFTNYIESCMNHWTGYIDETIFDINILIIDEKNIVSTGNNNETVLDAFHRHGITTHTVDFRHRLFWDGGMHCITSDLHREGTMQDYFPNRG